MTHDNLSIKNLPKMIMYKKSTAIKSRYSFILIDFKANFVFNVPIFTKLILHNIEFCETLEQYLLFVFLGL